MDSKWVSGSEGKPTVMENPPTFWMFPLKHHLEIYNLLVGTWLLFFHIFRDILIIIGIYDMTYWLVVTGTWLL